jgi:hypothetical protein
MRRELFIVARDRADLYRYLSQTFADAENVQVIWDRRTEQRRRTTTGPPTGTERRRADRRTHMGVEEELRSVGYSFLVLD